jgi:hypothetical protein
MGGYGGLNPWPLEYGGGPTEEETVYDAMRRAVGDGFPAPNENGIDGNWRMCRAMGIAALGTGGERAALQALPNLATDHIPVYEDLLGITPTVDEPDETRRQNNARAFTRKVQADVPELTVQLTTIDARLSIQEVPYDEGVIVNYGKSFEPQDGSPSFGGGRRSTAFPNYSTEFIVRVLFDLGMFPAPTSAEAAIIRKVKAFLNEVLPSWVSYSISTGGGIAGTGFILDQSLLDVTAMTPT